MQTSGHFLLVLVLVAPEALKCVGRSRDCFTARAV